MQYDVILDYFGENLILSRKYKGTDKDICFSRCPYLDYENMNCRMNDILPSHLDRPEGYPCNLGRYFRVITLYILLKLR